MIRTITHDQFKAIADMTKNVKGEYIIYNGLGRLIGIINGAICKSVNQLIDGGDIKFGIHYSNMSVLLKWMEANNMEELQFFCEELNPYCSIPTMILCNGFGNNFIPLMTVADVNNAIMTDFYYESINPSNLEYHEYLDLTNTNPDFANIMNMKSAEGAEWFKVDKYCMSLASTMFSVNKGDTVDLYIYETGGGTTFISRFYIKKKKKLIVTISIRWRLL